MSTLPNDQISKMRRAQRQPMEYLVFSGGGAKGAGYSGVHAALDDSGILPGIKAVAGSSAGSISAAAIATGISKEDYFSLTQNTNMKALLGEEGFIINKDGKPLLKLIATTIQNNVSGYLGSIDIKQVVNQRLQEVQAEISKLNRIAGKLPEKEFTEKSAELQKQASRLEKLRTTDSKELELLRQKSNSTAKITFGDLDLLRLINPDKFKDLIVTATRKDNGELTIFDARHSPNIEIAEACRASSSIPIVFKPHLVGGIEYVDGGYRDNIPMKYFDGEELKKSKLPEVEDVSQDPAKAKAARAQGRTMVFAFGGNMEDNANVAIYSAKEKIIDPGRLMAFLMDVVFKVLSKVGGQFKYSEEENKLHHRLRENALNTVVLDTGEIGTLSFEQAQAKAEYLHIKGYIQTMEYMNNHALGSKVDPNLGRKNFILGVYEESSKQSTIQSWANRFTGNHAQKMQGILDLCKEEPWQTKGPQYILSDLVIKAATRRSDGVLSTNTNTMTKLMGKLNDSYTSRKVVSDFVKLLKIDQLKDPRFDPKKTLPANLQSFKFTANDFDAFLSKAQENTRSGKEGVKSFSNRYAKKEPQVKTYIKEQKGQIGKKKADIQRERERNKAKNNSINTGRSPRI